MHVTIRLFAQHREIAGRDSYTVELPDGCTVADVFARVCADHPRIAEGARNVAFALNRTHAGGDALVRGDDEVAILPPVAGG